MSALNPFASFANGSIYPDPSPGDYLQPPTATILAPNKQFTRLCVIRKSMVDVR